MPRPPATGRPGTRVLPDPVAERHTLANTRPASINLRHARTGRDPAAPYLSAVPAAIQVQTARGQDEQEVATETVAVRGYVVKIDLATADTKVGDLVDVVTNPDDPDLAGRTLHVTEVPHGSLMLERVLVCQLND